MTNHNNEKVELQVETCVWAKNAIEELTFLVTFRLNSQALNTRGNLQTNRSRFKLLKTYEILPRTIVIS